MQTKKEYIKTRIDAVALELFATKGFEKAGMSEIARKAGISVGNMYLYYDNKEELFYSLIPNHLVENGKALLAEKVGSAFGISVRKVGAKAEVKKKQEEFLEFLIRYRLPLLAAFRHGQGTLYEGLSQEVLALILRLVGRYVRSIQKEQGHVSSPANEDVLRLVYANLLSGTLNLLQNHVSPEELQRRLEIFLKYHFGGLEKILDS